MISKPKFEYESDPAYFINYSQIWTFSNTFPASLGLVAIFHRHHHTGIFPILYLHFNFNTAHIWILHCEYLNQFSIFNNISIQYFVFFRKICIFWLLMCKRFFWAAYMFQCNLPWKLNSLTSSNFAWVKIWIERCLRSCWSGWRLATPLVLPPRVETK